MKQFLKFTLATIVGVIVASLLGTLIFFGIIGAIAGSTEKVTELKSNSVYQLDLDGSLVDRSEEDPFSAALAEAFGQPERVLRQIATMPDGRSYLWIARTVSGGQRGYGAPGKTFSVGLGCDIRHACHLVYAQGLDLHAPAAATPIGMGCKVCERHACPQRAFPYIGRALDVDENHSRFTPYGAGT